MSSRTTATRDLNRSCDLRRRLRRYSHWPYMTTSIVTATAPTNASAPDEPTVVIERQFHQRAGFEQKREIPFQRLTARIIRNDSSGDLFEIAEAEGLDHVCLDMRDLLVGLV